MSNLLQKMLSERPWLLADGATGTNFFAAGLPTGHAPELWNLDEPDKVRDQYRSFVDAGCDIILTNSFGGTRNRLKLHKAEDRVAEISTAAARLAREVAGQAGREIVVAGSMGPTGDMYMPLGELTMTQGTAAYAEQAKALAEGGVDVLWIETIYSFEELSAAVTGARATGLPVVCTMSFDTAGRTMMGITAAQFVEETHKLSPGPMALGGNCGIGPSELLTTLIGLREAAGADAVLVAKSNCGVPEFVDGEIAYQGTPELMADYARMCLDVGVQIVGGCCGTTPDHIRVMRAAMEAHTPESPPDLETIVERLGQVSKGAEKQFRQLGDK
ncbi:MAG: betaine--homocysteine S-methyltransferase [Proteobacteria bacterium]|nr:betaine--homocysteine S-methyltransferase [Pseudomonadota bacterium]